MVAAMTLGEGQAWVLIIGAITAPMLTFIGLVINYLQNRATVVQRNRVEHEVKIVRANTNAALGESLRVAMISAHLLANQSKKAEHVKLAAEAEAKYTNHQRQMAEAAAVESEGPKEST